MSLSQKDAANHYIVNTDTKGYTHFTFTRRPKASTKSTDAERIMELEKKQVELESRLSDKTISYNNELVELKKKQDELESIIEKKNALFYNAQIRENLAFQNVETKLKKQLVEKQEEIYDLAIHLYVLNNEFDRYLSNRDDKKLRQSIMFMKRRFEKVQFPDKYEYLKAIENVWDALRASREQQRKEEAQSGAMLHD